MEPGKILSVRSLSKRFGATRALSGVSLELRGGEVHALVGQNGSGKSTLIKILSGYHAPDSGGVASRGQDVKLPATAAELRRLGISFMHQDLGLVETMSVLENLAVGRYETGTGGHIRWRYERARTKALLERFGLQIKPDLPVARLSQTERVILGVIRALRDVEQGGGAGVLVLDEPTASLPVNEVDVLFDAMRRVTQAGSAVLFVTHHLDEVFAIADRVTVLKDGRVVATRAMGEIDESSLITMILGHDLVDLYPEPAPSASHATALEVSVLSGRVAQGVSLTLGEGEIVGVTGLVGAGHDELPYLIYGAERMRGGSIRVGGRDLRDPTPGRSKRAGLALLPADRARRSGILAATLRENVTLPSLRDYRRAAGLDHRRERNAVGAILNRFQVVPAAPERRLATLSGGNQQKALLAKWMQIKPRVLLLHEPTQGVDVGARKTIFELLRGSADTGTAVLWSSVEYEDLAHICDRVLVFRRGLVAAELRGQELSPESIARHCYQTTAA